MNKRNPFFPVLILILLLSAAGRLCFSQAEATAKFMEELKLFAKAIQAVMEGSVQDVKARDLFYGAAKGMLQTLGDKYSEFIEPKRFELLQINVKGEYAGIGVHLKLLDGVAAIETVQPGGSAEQAGLKAGDDIHVKGKAADFEQAVESLQLDHKNVDSAQRGEEVAVKLSERAKEGDAVYKKS